MFYLLNRELNLKLSHPFPALPVQSGPRCPSSVPTPRLGLQLYDLFPGLKAEPRYFNKIANSYSHMQPEFVCAHCEILTCPSLFFTLKNVDNRLFL